MKNNYVSQLEDEIKTSLFWWKRLREDDENGHLKKEFSGLPKLTPRIRVIRELQRLAFLAVEGLDDLRHKLLKYRTGDFWIPIGGMEKEDMDIPSVDTILLVGLVGSGKSSLINLMYSVIGRSGLIPFAQTAGVFSNHTTMYLEEHFVTRSLQSGFCVYDTRGLDQERMSEGLDDVWIWMRDGIRHHQPCFRSGDKQNEGLGASNGSMEVSNSCYIKRKVNCVMVVADLSQIHKAFTSGDLKQMQALSELFHFPYVKTSNENPILILTHGDTLNPEDRLMGRIKICQYLGISETRGVYDIACLTEQGFMAEEFDSVSAFALTEAIYRALLQSDGTHTPKRNFQYWMMFLFSWIMSFFATLFAKLALFFSEFAHHKRD